MKCILHINKQQKNSKIRLSKSLFTHEIKFLRNGILKNKSTDHISVWLNLLKKKINKPPLDMREIKKKTRELHGLESRTLVGRATV